MKLVNNQKYDLAPAKSFLGLFTYTNWVTYGDIQIVGLAPIDLAGVFRACKHTMAKIRPEDVKADEKSTLLNFLLSAGHMNPLQHAVISFEVYNMSRACAMQFVRHWTISFTQTSQHYQNYETYPVIIPTNLVGTHQGVTMLTTANRAGMAYQALLADGVPKEEARYVLPENTACNMVVTMNLRSLVTFIQTRSCVRNVPEMRYFANLLAETVINAISCSLETKKVLQKYLAPACCWGKCKEGSMSCMADGNSYGYYKDIDYEFIRRNNKGRCMTELQQFVGKHNEAS